MLNNKLLDKALWKYSRENFMGLKLLIFIPANLSSFHFYVAIESALEAVFSQYAWNSPHWITWVVGEACSTHAQKFGCAVLLSPLITFSQQLTKL